MARVSPLLLFPQQLQRIFLKGPDRVSLRTAPHPNVSASIHGKSEPPQIKSPWTQESGDVDWMLTPTGMVGPTEII